MRTQPNRPTRSWLPATAAALTLLSIATTVMAATGGGDFPRLR